MQPMQVSKGMKADSYTLNILIFKKNPRKVETTKRGNNQLIYFRLVVQETGQFVNDARG